MLAIRTDIALEQTFPQFLSISLNGGYQVKDTAIKIPPRRGSFEMIERRM